jgi:tyrosyl-DNA phosphodiesterase-1
MKIIFPSDATVEKSILGRDVSEKTRCSVVRPADGTQGGGTMFCSKAMNSVTRPLFHDANSKRGGVLMHAKVSLPRGEYHELITRRS